MDVEFLLALLRERHFITEQESNDLLRQEVRVRQKIFRENRDDYAGRLANANSVHAIDVVLAFELFSEPGRELDENKLTQFIADKKQVPFVHLDPLKVNMEILTKHISRPFARKHLVVPTAEDGEHLECALVDPFDAELIFSLKRNTGMAVRVVVAPKSEIVRILTEFYGFRQSVKRAEQDLSPIRNLGNLEQLVQFKSERELKHPTRMWSKRLSICCITRSTNAHPTSTSSPNGTTH